MTEVHQAPVGGKGGRPRSVPVPPLDLGNHAAVRDWLYDLRTKVDDAIAAGEDATRPLAERDLGRRIARAAILDARDALNLLILAAERGAADDEPLTTAAK